MIAASSSGRTHRETSASGISARFAGPRPGAAFQRSIGVSKAGVVALAESLRKALHGAGVGISVLCPMRVTSNIDQSYRNRPAALGGPIANTYSEEDRAELVGRTLSADAVAALVLEGIRRNQAYIHTHLFRARAERILARFDTAL